MHGSIKSNAEMTNDDGNTSPHREEALHRNSPVTQVLRDPSLANGLAHSSPKRPMSTRNAQGLSESNVERWT